MKEKTQGTLKRGVRESAFVGAHGARPKTAACSFSSYVIFSRVSRVSCVSRVSRVSRVSLITTRLFSAGVRRRFPVARRAPLPFTPLALATETCVEGRVGGLVVGRRDEGHICLRGAKVSDWPSPGRLIS